MEKEERNRMLWAAGITVVILILFGLMLAIGTQPRVFSPGEGNPAAFIIREDFHSGAFDELVSAIMIIALALVMMVVGGVMMFDGSRGWGIFLWLMSFPILYAALTKGRDSLTLSELRIVPSDQSVSCSGYLFGSRIATRPALLSEISLISFPKDASGRFGVQADSKGAIFCSLHNKTLDRGEAQKLGNALKTALGPSRVNVPP